jgi:hypothetical protein
MITDTVHFDRAVEAEARKMCSAEYKAANPGSPVMLDNNRVRELEKVVYEKMKTDKTLLTKLKNLASMYEFDSIQKELNEISAGGCSCGVIVGTCRACGGYTRY